MSFAEIQKKQTQLSEEKHKARMERIVPVAKKVLRLLVENLDTLALGDIEKTDASHEELAKKFLALLLEENINWTDRELVFQIALQALSYPADIAQNSLKNSWERVITGLFGKHVNELTVKEVDEALKKGDDIYSKSETVVQ